MEDNLSMRIGRNLRIARNKLGLTQGQVASRIFLTTPTYNAYEMGKRCPTPWTLNQLADIFNVSVDWLMGRTPATTGEPCPAGEKMEFMVMEIYDREIKSVTPCATMDMAISAANDLLKTHIHDIGKDAEFQERKGRFDRWDWASINNKNAWCNWSEYEWDAHIIHI